MDTTSYSVDHKMDGNIDNNSKDMETYSSVYLTDISDISHIILNDSQTYIILSDSTGTTGTTATTATTAAPVDSYKCPLCEYSTGNMLDFKKHLQANMGQKQCIPEVSTPNNMVTEAPINTIGITSTPEITNSNTLHTETESPMVNIGMISDQTLCTSEVTNSNQINTEDPVSRFKCPLCEYYTYDKVNFKKHLVNNIGQNRTQCIPEIIKPDDLTLSKDTIQNMKPTHANLYQGIPRKMDQNRMQVDLDENIEEKGEQDSIKSEHISPQYITNITQRIISSESNEEPTNNLKFSNIEQKKYKCSYCKKCFDQKVYLSQHLKKHSAENPYKCTTCEKGFISEQYLTRHQRTHTEEKSYQCTHCTDCFTSIEHMIKHKRTAHNGAKRKEIK